MDVALPDGTIIRGVPEGTSRKELAAKLKKSGYNIPPDWETPEEPKRSIGERLRGAGEAAVTLATGVPASIAGAGSAIDAATKNLLYRAAGLPNRPDAEQAFNETVQSLTYAPRSQAGQEAVQSVAETLAPLQALPGMQGELTALNRAAQLSRPTAQVMGSATAARGQQVAQQAGQRIQQATQSVQEAVPFGRGSVGAAEVPQAIQRRATAEQLGFTGESALTRGQASRSFDELQFEKETAKRGDIGAPLRERSENQTATLLQNFDALVDKAQPIAVAERDIGKAVDKALVNKANIAKKQINRAYEKARESGELAEPVSMEPVAQKLQDLQRFEGVAGNIGAIRKEAQRLGAIGQDEAGAFVGRELSIDNAELLRQFVNDATDWADPRQARMAKIVNSSIDQATDSAAGQLYKQARKLRSDYAREFENVGLTSKLLGTKRGTDERAIAFDDVFRKTILDSPVEEMNKLRRTLITAGPEGKQAWQDLKAKGIQHIKDQSLNAGMSERGQPLLSPAKLNRTIQSLDREGKLESLYGKKQAQQLRDLAEIANVIYTAPPGAINTSNTASALQVVLDTIGTGALTGVSLPVATSIREATKFVKNAKTRTRINQTLNVRQAQ